MKKNIAKDSFQVNYHTRVDGVEITVSLQWVGDSSEKEDALNTIKKYLGVSNEDVSTQNYLH